MDDLIKLGSGFRFPYMTVCLVLVLSIYLDQGQKLSMVPMCLVRGHSPPSRAQVLIPGFKYSAWGQNTYFLLTFMKSVLFFLSKKNLHLTTHYLKRGAEAICDQKV